MAQGRSNAAIAAALFVTDKAISKHTSNIFMKLDLDQDDDSNNRRVNCNDARCARAIKARELDARTVGRLEQLAARARVRAAVLDAERDRERGDVRVGGDARAQLVD